MHASTLRSSTRPHRPRRRPAPLLATPLLALGLVGALAACGSEEGPTADATSSSTSTSPSSPSSASSEPSESSAPAGRTIQVRIAGDDVTPSDKRIEITAGEPVTVRVESDRKGELHVHSSPETTFDFGAGTSSKTFTIARPGIVEMEEHDSDTLVAQLEAR